MKSGIACYFYIYWKKMNDEMIVSHMFIYPMFYYTLGTLAHLNQGTLLSTQTNIILELHILAVKGVVDAVQ